jgi:hypothetical protein
VLLFPYTQTRKRSQIRARKHEDDGLVPLKKAFPCSQTNINAALNQCISGSSFSDTTLAKFGPFAFTLEIKEETRGARP